MASTLSSPAAGLVLAFSGLDERLGRSNPRDKRPSTDTRSLRLGAVLVARRWHRLGTGCWKTPGQSHHTGSVNW
jgi:hypothetical protein